MNHPPSTIAALEEVVERAMDKFQFPVGWEWTWEVGGGGDVGIHASFDTYDAIRDETRHIEAHRQLSAYILRINGGLSQSELWVKKVQALISKTILEMLSVDGVVQ